MYKSRILLVDDDNDILDLLQLTFQKEGYEKVSTCTSAEEALVKVQSEAFDLILLDVMLPRKTGFEILPFIKEYTNCPIFFLTAKKTDYDKLAGFAFGADDYITKPFNPLEVIARSNAMLKRTLTAATAHPMQPEVYDYGYFKLDVGMGELTVKGAVEDCSAQLFQLLLYFCQNPNRVLTKEQIYEYVWGTKGKFVDNNTITVHVYKLREKIEPDPKKPQFLQTVRGLGYKLVKR
ncbi:response regulator transcription factor [Metabacillus idriensis]|uniref:response regulator transcription factor n=1 Tax=Metabacillus idriensis TaxID=324768 RepID=UPI00203CB322|nr:response regulator transcription factor [Metabacillus idriensis]